MVLSMFAATSLYPLVLLSQPDPVEHEERNAALETLLETLLDTREIPAARIEAARELQSIPPGPDAVSPLVDLVNSLRPETRKDREEVVDLDSGSTSTVDVSVLLPLGVWQKQIALGAEVAVILGKMRAESAVPSLNDFLASVLVQARLAADKCNSYQRLGLIERETRESADVALAIDKVAVRVVKALGDFGPEANQAVPLLATALKRPIFPARSLYEPVGTEISTRDYFLPVDLDAEVADDLDQFRIESRSGEKPDLPARRDDESMLRDAALDALGSIGTLAAVQALRDVIVHGDEDEVLAPRRLRELAREKLDEMARQHPDEKTREAAAKALDRLRQ